MFNGDDYDDDEPNKFEIYVNKIRSILLQVADKEMIVKLKNPTTKINTEYPRVVNYCKENNFVMTINEKFCSSRVTYNEESLKNAFIKGYQRHHKKRSTFGNFSSKFITRIPTVRLNSQYNLNTFGAMAYNSTKHKINTLLRNNKFQFHRDSFTNSNINFFLSNAKTSKFVEENGILPLPQAQQSPPESPTMKKLKVMKKHNITKKSIFVGGGNSRNNQGAYIEDPEVYLRIKESFIYIRSLPYLKVSSLKPKTPEKKIREQRELERKFKGLEESLLIRDVPEKYEDIANSKISKTKIKALKMRKKNSLKNCSLKNGQIKNLSPVNKSGKKRMSDENLFTLDLRSAVDHNYNFKLNLQDLDFDIDNKAIMTHKERRVSGVSIPDSFKSFSSKNPSEDENDNKEENNRKKTSC